MDAQDNKWQVSSRFLWGFLSVLTWYQSEVSSLFEWSSCFLEVSTLPIGAFVVFLVIAVVVFLGFNLFNSCVWGMYLGRCWLIDDTHHVEADNNSRILGGLTLRVIEVAKHYNNNVFHSWTEVNEILGLLPGPRTTLNDQCLRSL